MALDALSFDQYTLAIEFLEGIRDLASRFHIQNIWPSLDEPELMSDTEPNLTCQTDWYSGSCTIMLDRREQI